MKKQVLKLLAVAALATSAFGAHAADANVTNAVIFGSGVTNGNFTVNNIQNGGVEIGLRARVRFDAANNPTNDNASNGDGTYSVPAGNPSPGFSFQPNSTSSAKWNFDWSINTDPTNVPPATAVNVNAFTYLLSMDFDPGVGTNFQSFDLINSLPYFDHSFGNNNTAQGAGVEAPSGNAAAYSGLVGANNLVQNSWNYEFFDSVAFPFNGNTNGNYTIRLSAFSGQTLVSSSQIDVIVGTGAIPEPGSLALVGLALTGLVVARRRKQVK